MMELTDVTLTQQLHVYQEPYLYPLTRQLDQHRRVTMPRLAV